LPATGLQLVFSPLFLFTTLLPIGVAEHDAATTRQQGLPSLPPEKGSLRCDAARGSLLELPAGSPDMRDPGAQIQTVWRP